MKLHLSSGSAQNIFTAHGDGYVAINGRPYRHAVAVMPDRVLEDWRPAGFEAMSAQDFSFFLAHRPDVLLLGTGIEQRFVHPELHRALTDAGIAVECMNTPAACRTYNILVAEDRKVAAAILL